MTYKLLTDILKENNIPEDVVMWSDSGWECDPTNMNCIYYNKTMNVIVFTQFPDSTYYKDNDWKEIYVDKKYEDWGKS